MSEDSSTEAGHTTGNTASNDWWMYHADERHSGNASGQSNISSASVHQLITRHTIVLDHPIISVPAIVQGKIYVGTRSLTSGGTLYKIDLTTGAINGTFAVPFAGGGHWE